MGKIVQVRQRGFEAIGGKDIQMPQRADKGSCGYDFYSPTNVTLKPNEQKLIFTGIKAYMLEDEALIMNVRSSQGELRLQLANTQGWIDSTYYGNPKNDGDIGIFLRNESDKTYCIQKDDKIAQCMFIKYLTTDDDSPLSNMREGGFGSTGVK